MSEGRSFSLFLTEYVPRALHTIGLLADADNSYTSLIDYVKPVLTKARATSDDVLLDAADAAKIFMDAAWAAGEARLLAAYKSSTRRSASLVGETFRGRVAFDEFKTSMKEASSFMRRFPRASLAMGLSAGSSSGGGGRDDRGTIVIDDGGGGVRDASGGGGGAGGDGGGGHDPARISRPGSRAHEIVHHAGDFSKCFSFSRTEGAAVYSEARILAALKARPKDKTGKGVCCIHAVALEGKNQNSWCKCLQLGEKFRHGAPLTTKEQRAAGVVVARLSAAGVPQARKKQEDEAAPDGGGGGENKRKSSFRRQAAGSAKRQA